MKNLKIIYFLMIAIAVTSSMSVKSYATGSIGGTVIDVNSENISDARVFAVLDSNTVGTDLTDDDGTYVIIGLEAGSYKVKVKADGYERRIETDVVVTDGNNTIVDINNLYIEGVIEGKVLQPNGTTGIAGAHVSAYDANNYYCITSKASDANGCYTIYNLPAATYSVKILYGVSDYEFSKKENVVVTAGNTTSDIDFTGTVRPTGKISGTVTESDGTTTIENAYVLAMDSANKVAALDTSDSNGYYELGDLATGTYTVRALRSTGVQIAKVDSVSVTDGSTTSQDLSSAGGSISGAVKNSSQTAIQGAVLTAMKDGKIYKAASDSSGNYTIQFLPAGDYQLSIDPNDNDYVASKINDVTVVANQQTSNQDFTLCGPDGKITGTITDSSQDPIEGALVIAIEPNDANDDPNVTFIPATTSADGTYTISYLRSSTDYIIFVSADGYVSDSETNVSVTAGQTTSGKNFSLGTTGGTISGTVYQSDGQTPIENAMVQCRCPGKSFSAAMSDSNGDYSLPLLQAGTYQVDASAGGYDMETLSDVVVTGTLENSGNDFTLDEE